ncbi:MAG: alpha/beta fold hydrolase [Spirochaetes bacterium]|nr:MAG: alpha/beta fold hydrolase [Spirochaetota bacterium]
MVTVWYPAQKGTREHLSFVSVFEAGWSTKDADISNSKEKYPLIMLSHGTGGFAASIAWLGKKLARRGFIVAAVNHHGNTGAESKTLLQGFVLWWERPRDISVLIDRLIDDALMGPKIDAHNIGVAGFSLGGYTALATVGARLDIEKWGTYCAGKPSDPQCSLPPEAPFTMDEAKVFIESNADALESWKYADDDFSDKRIKAAYVIAPVLGPVISPRSLAKIDVPVKIVAGGSDDQGIPALNAMPISGLIPNSRLLVMPHVTHYMFLTRGNIAGRIMARRYFIDPEGTDRTKVQDDVGDDATAFFNRHLKN